jgi:hypothetical protein
MFTWGTLHEGSRLMSFDEAQRLYPWMATGARAEWDMTVAGLEERLGDGAKVVPERESNRAWNQRGLCVHGRDVGLSDHVVSKTTTDAASERELHGAIRKALGEIRNGKEPEPVDWESLLRNTFQGVETPIAEE